MQTGEECYAAWAPSGSVWSLWAKPVLFAQAGVMLEALSTPIAAPDLAGIPDMWNDPAIVIDLPGAEAVAAGLALVARGFRPVPMFNGTSGPAALVDVEPVCRALAGGASQLRDAALLPDARPAFLIDALRMQGQPAEPGQYDNRWVVLPQDFPSATFLRTHHVRGITVVQRGEQLAQDLAHVLRRWQEGGLALRVLDVSTNRVLENVVVPRPSMFRLAWYGAIALFGLRRNNIGGFGAAVPENSSRGGFYG